MAAPPVPATPLSPTSAATVIFRSRGRLLLRAAGDLAPYLGQADVLLTELDASARVGPARGHVHIDGAGRMELPGREDAWVDNLLEGTFQAPRGRRRCYGAARPRQGVTV